MALPVPKLDPRDIGAYARQAWLMRHDVRRPVLPRNAGPDDDVVVFLHGLFATAGVLRPLRERLERHPRVHAAALSYPPGPGVRSLVKRLGALLAELPDQVHVHLLGHSLGGVVARYYAQEVGDPRIVQTISMASPFAGVRTARLLGGVELARDLSPNSGLLRKLRLGGHRHLRVPHLSIVAEHDRMIGAPLSHALPGGEVFLVRCGHNRLLYHPAAAKAVESRIVELAGSPRRRD
jgi:pimeloyl-ACP methyl ester carboxylesterase